MPIYQSDLDALADKISDLEVELSDLYVERANTEDPAAVDDLSHKILDTEEEIARLTDEEIAMERGAGI